MPDITAINDFTFTEVLDELGIAYSADFPETGGAEITIHQQIITQE
jgi:hypothetical protein